MVGGPKKNWDAGTNTPNGVQARFLLDLLRIDKRASLAQQEQAIHAVEKGIRNDIVISTRIMNSQGYNEQAINKHRLVLEIAIFRFALKDWNTADIHNDGPNKSLGRSHLVPYLVGLVRTGLRNDSLMEPAKVAELQQLAGAAFTPPAPGSWSVPASCALLSIESLRLGGSTSLATSTPSIAHASVASSSSAALGNVAPTPATAFASVASSSAAAAVSRSVASSSSAAAAASRSVASSSAAAAAISRSVASSSAAAAAVSRNVASSSSSAAAAAISRNVAPSSSSAAAAASTTTPLKRKHVQAGDGLAASSPSRYGNVIDLTASTPPAPTERGKASDTYEPSTPPTPSPPSSPSRPKRRKLNSVKSQLFFDLSNDTDDSDS